ncbi:MAG: hypothetical protein ABTB30_06730, partial [Clostridia bacterium]
PARRRLLFPPGLSTRRNSGRLPGIVPLPSSRRENYFIMDLYANVMLFSLRPHKKPGIHHTIQEKFPSKEQL